MRSPSLLLAALLLFAADAHGDQVAPAPLPSLVGLELGTFSVGRQTYHEVRVRSRDSRSLVFTHRGGLGSVRLHDLPPEIQKQIGFDPWTAPPEAPPPSQAAPPAPPPRPAQASAPARPLATTSQLDQLFLTLQGPAPEIRTRQSLQPEFIQLGLAAKSQGRRPSCAVYAIVGALEFQNARLTGAIEKLSEEYLIWAVRRSLGLTTPSLATHGDSAPIEFQEDAGFTLPSVIAALQRYGIPLHEDMRNQPGLAAAAVPEPPAEIIERARSRRLVFISPIHEQDPALSIPRLVHALNAGFPVPAGLRWPHDRAITGGTLSAQQPLPGAFHAVTFIGYESPSGRIEDAVFVFKNSYGPRWGQGGYGRATYAYLARNLLDAYVLDVRPPAASGR